MGNRGFTTIEMVLVVVLIGIIATIGLPRLRNMIDKQNRRTMRTAIVNYVATTRNSAVARGCRSSLHFVSGGDSRMWVTSCEADTLATQGAGRDTLIGPVWTIPEWGYKLTSGRDSLTYDSRGLRIDFERTLIVLRTKGDVPKDSVVVNQVGKVVYP